MRPFPDHLMHVFDSGIYCADVECPCKPDSFLIVSSTNINMVDIRLGLEQHRRDVEHAQKQVNDDAAVR